MKRAAGTVRRLMDTARSGPQFFPGSGSDAEQAFAEQKIRQVGQPVVVDFFLNDFIAFLVQSLDNSLSLSDASHAVVH